MSTQLFPALVQSLSQHLSRRQVAPLGLGVALGLSALDPAPATAKKSKKKKKTCKAAQTRCGKRCANLQTSANHCGACGNACADWLVCHDSACTWDPYRGTWGSQGTAKDELSQPTGIARATSGGFFWVTDSDNHRIQRIRRDGTFLGPLATKQGPVDVPTPSGVAESPTKPHLFVSSSSQQLIFVYHRKTGTLLRTIGSPNPGPGQLMHPIGMAVSPDGTRLYVTDWGADKVVIFDTATGNAVATWGTPGSGANQLTEPNAIAVSPDGARIFVTDSGNSRVRIYDANGTVKGNWGAKGNQINHFAAPRGIAVSEDGSRLLVSDYGLGRVSVWQISTGKALGAVPVHPDMQVLAMGIAAGPAKFAYVIERSNHQVHRLSLVW